MRLYIFIVLIILMPSIAQATGLNDPQKYRCGILLTSKFTMSEIMDQLADWKLDLEVRDEEIERLRNEQGSYPINKLVALNKDQELYDRHLKHLVDSKLHIDGKQASKAELDAEIAKLVAEKRRLGLPGTMLELIEACRSRDLSRVQSLIQAGVPAHRWQRGDRYIETPIDAAAGTGDLAIIEYLYQHGVKVSGQSIREAAINGHLYAVKLLLKKSLEQGISLEQWSVRDALIGAAENGFIEIVEHLLDAGVKTEIKDEEYLGIDVAYRSAMISAAKNNQLEVVNLLIRRGIDVNATDGKRASLELEPLSRDPRYAIEAALKAGHLRIVERLLESGANRGFHENDPLIIQAKRNISERKTQAERVAEETKKEAEETRRQNVWWRRIARSVVGKP